MGADGKIILLSIAAGAVALLNCFLYFVLHDSTWEQFFARKWCRAGGKTDGYLLHGRILEYGDPRHRNKEAVYRVIYTYEVAGELYRTTTVLAKDYPTMVTVYYNPKAPGNCVVSTRALTVGRIDRFFLWAILIVTAAVGVSYLLLTRFLT